MAEIKPGRCVLEGQLPQHLKFLDSKTDDGRLVAKAGSRGEGVGFLGLLHDEKGAENGEGACGERGRIEGFVGQPPAQQEADDGDDVFIGNGDGGGAVAE